jgi:hypothetical protein
MKWSLHDAMPNPLAPHIRLHKISAKTWHQDVPGASIALAE